MTTPESVSEVEVVPAAPVSAPVAVVTPPAEFVAAIRYREMAKLAASQATVFMVLCGAELVRLKKDLGATHGGNRKQGFSGETMNFEDAAEQAGFSKSSAWRYIQLYEAGRKKVTDYVRPLLELPVTALSEEQKEIVTKAVAKVTDGKSQLELFRDWGIAKKESKGPGGARKPGEPENLTEEARRELAMQSAREHFIAAGDSLAATGADFTLLPDEELHAVAGNLRRYLDSINLWLRAPQSKRGPELVKAIVQATAHVSASEPEPAPADEEDLIDARV